jgi:hypothetical protein
VVVAVAVILASAIGVVSCGSSPPKKAVSTVTSTTATLATTGPRAVTTTTGATSSSTPTAGAAADLGGYVAAAQRVDARIKAAATLVNAHLGPNGITDQATLDAVNALEPDEAAAAIPAGLPPALLLKVLTVQSDLFSRSAALSGGIGARGDFNGQGLQRATTCLKNGAEAAKQFASDLAAAQTLAAASPPLVATAPGSHAAGELAVRLEELKGLNYGCAACGGQLLTELAPVTWYDVPRTSPAWGTSNGDIGGLTFGATYTAGKGWNIQIHAC